MELLHVSDLLGNYIYTFINNDNLVFRKGKKMKKLSFILSLLLLGLLFPIFVSSPVKSDIGWSTPTQLTFNTAIIDWYPSISGDGTKIVFMSAMSGDDWEIFVVNSDGSGLTQLTSNTLQDEGPCISGDGSKIAFHSFGVDFWPRIFVVNSDGSGLTQLTTNTESNCWFSSISGDGTKIAFESDMTPDKGSEIFVVNSDGSGLTQLTTNTAWDGSPSISGDGTKIAFESNVDGDSEIFVVNSDGSGLTQLTSNTVTDCGPSISDDGTKIAFASTVDGDPEIFLVSLLTSIHNLDTGLDYLTIQAAIDAPETLNGHTIFVENGTYSENVSVTKSIILMGL